ncbi:hypothetical protein [Stenotrophomonas maltophilia]|uniref:hypothetical protein n=1 Tax=Stenotrophomonas maltophilia TaxID=40324 RepID=UPI0013D9EA76|nr:hypothetical protein [Stenotrophomonas maltophilia]MBC8772339.1 hypothetical protein [Stenotrophomonas maltophilia]MBH1591426.1 hypothetical protein [Stenotrophomonas maltophilia]
MDSILGPGNLILQVLFLIMAIVWLFVPFAVLAIRRLLAQLVQKQDETNRLLRALAAPASGQAAISAEDDRDRPTIGNILKQVRDR